ncbi:alanine racemase [Paenibacillus sp. MBLB4367]|uniref:alanine racemase n=1 Tax=Paenibacillus sp. MBLB4367 TaxID=3384767 RepID=UPI003907FF7E
MRKQELDTPYVIIDLDKTERNIAAMQEVADKSGIGLRPHGKTHKLPPIGRMQIEAGAVGLTVAKLGEAEVMADAGIRDILIAYPIVGEAKLARLVRLAQRADVTVALDSLDVAAPMSRAAEAAGVSIGVVVELDSGFGRVGLSRSFPGCACAAC